MAFTKCNVAANIIGLITRRSENDNIPQPLDQLTNSPFIGQQVGNCKSFTLTHCLADLFATHHDSRSIPLHTQHHIQLTSLSFQVSQPSHSWVTAISIFLPWKSKVKVMGEVKVWSHNVSLTFYRLTSLSFHVNQPSHSIPEIWLFQNLTLKIQGQGHGRGERWNSLHGFNILSTHIPFVPCQSALPFLRYSIFKILTLKIQGQGHGWGRH